MKVLHVITELGPGGAQEMLARLCTQSARQSDIQLAVVSLLDDGIHAPRLRDAGATVYALGMQRGVPSPGSIVRLVRILRRERPDVMMTWLYAADLLGTVAARIAGVRRLFWNIRCSDMDLRAYRPTTRWTIHALARLSGMPTGVAANSRAGRLVHERLGYKPRAWHHLPNGIDTSVWRPRPELRRAVRQEFQLTGDTRLVAVMGRADPMKDHATFLEAAAILATRGRDVNFLVAGKGTESLVVPGSLRGRVHLAGHRSDGNRLLAGIDVLVMSSAFGEGFPNVVCEAMSSGVPCAVTDVGDAAELVGDTGRVVQPRDPTALAEAIDSILRLSDIERASLGARARLRVQENWSIENAAARYEALWRDSLARGA